MVLELADKGGEIIEKADAQDEADPAGDAEETVPAGAMRQLGDPLPELPKAKGENTRSVLFVTDKFLQKIVKEKRIFVAGPSQSSGMEVRNRPAPTEREQVGRTLPLGYGL